MFPTCSRKDFIHLVAGTGVLNLIGCSSGDDDASPGAQAGTGGTGAGGTSTGGTTSMAGNGGTGTGGTGGSSATGGSGGTGVAGSSTGGGAGHAASGGAASTAGGAGAAAGSGGSGQGGMMGMSGSSAGGRVGSGGATTGGGGGMVNGAGGGGKAGAGGTSAGGMSGSAGSGGSACLMDITAQISMNHGHTLIVPLADVRVGAAKIYNARGTATHDHYVQVTQADFQALLTGGTVKKVACNGGDHEFVLSCGTATEQAGDPKCSSSDMCASSMSMLCPDPT